MNRSLVIVRVMRDEEEASAVDGVLRAISGHRVAVTKARDPEAAKTALTRGHVDALVVGLEFLEGTATGRVSVSELAELAPLILVGPPGTRERGADALRVGARDYVMCDAHLARSLTAAIQAVTSRPDPAKGEVHRRTHGRVIGFVGAHGGCGTTTTVLNTAVALAHQKRRVIAAELGTWASSFAAQFKAEPSATLDQLLLAPEHIGRLTEQYLVELIDGVRVLYGSPAPRSPVSGEEQLNARVVHALAELSDYVLVDLPTHLPPAYRTAVRHLDHVVLVTEPYAALVPRCSELVERLHGWGIGVSRMSLVVVKRDGDAPDALAPHAVARDVGLALAGTLPPAGEACRQACERGLPVLISSAQSPLCGAVTATTLELVAAVDHQRLKVAVVNADEDTARRLEDTLEESDPVRFELTFARGLDDILADAARGSFHAVLVVPRGTGEELDRDVSRIAMLAERSAVVVLALADADRLMHACVQGGAQDCVELGRGDGYWLAHAVTAAVERQRMMHRLQVRNRELETCEASHRRIIMQLLRDAQHDPRMV